MKILDKITKQYQQNLPFVAYKKPNKNLISGFFQKTDELFFTNDFSKSGFVFAPFNSEKKAVLLPTEVSEFITEPYLLVEKLNLKTVFNEDIAAKEHHIELVEKALLAIQKKEFKKVVISRKEKVKLQDFELITVFKKLLQAYKNAMVYVWYHPKVGLWLGATPETLLKENNGFFETMSLAGTQLFNGSKNVVWKAKELEEQQLVTNYIVQNLQDVVASISVSEVETAKAGTLLHLRTKISGKLKSKDLKLVEFLHPTPAVCGLPLNSSKEFILKNEGYNRTFYSGFLGELNINNSSEFFVNLRCMEIVNEQAFVYVGGGITKDSNATKEWEETVAKTYVIKKVL